MGKSWPRNLYVPVPILGDFVATLTELFTTLFTSAHDHAVRSAAPAATEGAIGDIVVVDTGSSRKIYAKTSGGWFSATLS